MHTLSICTVRFPLFLSLPASGFQIPPHTSEVLLKATQGGPFWEAQIAVFLQDDTFFLNIALHGMGCLYDEEKLHHPKG